jgi:endoglucanase
LFLTCFSEVAVGQTYTSLWNSYAAHFMDDQVRVIDHDSANRTTSEGQAYAMFFALVANDRARFDGLLKWTEANLAGGDLASHLPAWSWGHRADNTWSVLDDNSAADADVWMAYTLLEAGKAWKEARYTWLGTALATKIASEEVARLPGFGVVLLPAPKGFRKEDSCRLNISYMPLQVFQGLARDLPAGPWDRLAANVPRLVAASSRQEFAMDWVDYRPPRRFTPSESGSYDAIRVYLWAGMLDPQTSRRKPILQLLLGMAKYLRSNAVPPAKVMQDGSIGDAKGPIGFSAALLPYLSATGNKDLADQQLSRLRASLNPSTGLYGDPARYYDQNLALFSLGWSERRLWFGSNGALRLDWVQ